MRGANRAPDAAADRRPRPRPSRGHEVPGSRSRRPGAQGRVLRPLPPAPDPGLQPRPRRRHRAPAHRAAHPEEAAEAHDRGGRRPARRQALGSPTPHGLGGDRARAGRGNRQPRVRRCAGRRPRPGAVVQRAPRVPQRRPVLRGPRTSIVLVQLPVRGVPPVHRPRDAHGGRPRPHRPRPGPLPGRGRRLAVGERAHLGVLRPPRHRPGRRARGRRQHALQGPSRRHARGRPARVQPPGPRPLPQPLRPRALLLDRVRGGHPVRAAPARRVRE